MYNPASPSLRFALHAAMLLALPAVPGATVLDSLLSLLPQRYQSVISQHDRYNLQIMYTRIDRDARNVPHFDHFSFNVDAGAGHYFYPASLVKLPVAVLALEKINALGIKGLTSRTPMRIDRTLDCPISYESADSLPSDTASVESSVKRMLLVSDNSAHNRLWEFLTKDYANRRLAECGFGSMLLLHRFAGCDTLQNRMNNPIGFFEPRSGKVLYQQPLAESRSVPDHNPLAPFCIGSFSYRNGVLLARPYRADNLNFVPLDAIHRLVISIMFPSSVTQSKALRLKSEDYRLLRTWMCLLPREGGWSAYVPDSGYPDNFKKYLLFGDSTRPCLPHLREFNVVGRAYGFMSDVAYFADFDARVEFFLSATIFANEDDIINDDQYEYASLALPFFSALGETVYEYEKTRPRRHRPDLREFMPTLPTIEKKTRP
ncbi:MAG: serine hydrolase [Chitinispirillaceae bacterium]|jgi:hypothetical protein